MEPITIQIIVAVVALLLLLVVGFRKGISSMLPRRKRSSDLDSKQTTKLKIRFSDCEIMEGTEIIGDAADAWNSDTPAALGHLLPGDSEIKKVEVSYIIFRTSFFGGERKFVSEAIDKNKDTLKFYLDEKKSTILFVEKANPDNYHFDLGFLSTKRTQNA